MAEETEPTRKIFRSSRQSEAGLMLTEKSASLLGSQGNFVVCDERGVTIKGPISLVAQSSDIRTGGLFVGLNDFLEMIPSTLVTPIPKKIPFPPVFALSGIQTDVAFFMSLLI